jgi:hypothetical protein
MFPSVNTYFQGTTTWNEAEIAKRGEKLPEDVNLA